MWRKLGSFTEQVTFNLDIVDEYNLALQKWAISGNVCTEINSHFPMYGIVVKSMDSEARVQVLALPFNSWEP